MRKLVSILCSITILLVSVLNLTFIQTFASAEGAVKSSPALYKFTDKTETETLLSQNRITAFNGNTVFEYDEQMHALKVSPRDITATKACQFTLNMLNKTTNVSDYPVIAIKLKANNASRNTCGIWPGTKVDGRSIYSCGDVCNSYNRTGTWEILMYDGTNSGKAGYEGLWDSIIVRLMSDAETPNENDYTWIEWIGVFASVDDVYAYDPDMAPTPFFYDFSNETDGKTLINDGRIVNDAGTTVAYDTDESAVKVTSTGTNANRFRIPAGNSAVKVSDYPVMAMMVKFTVDNVKFGGIAAGCNHGLGGSIYGSGYVATDIYKNGGYQLVVFDGTDFNTKYSGTWNAMLVALAANGTQTTTDLACWIKWVGVFDSTDSAYAYADTPSAFYYDFSDEGDTNGFINSKRVVAESNTFVQYNSDEAALEVLPTNNGTACNHRVALWTSDGTKTSVSDYPVMAIMIKPKNADKAFGGIAAGTKRSSSGVFASGFQKTNVAFDDGWQIILYDGSANAPENYSGLWSAMLLNLTNDNVATDEQDGWYIKWAGVFKSAADAKTFAAGIDTEFFYDFSEKNTTDSLISKGKVNVSGSNVSLSYDSTEGALKAEPKTAGKGNHQVRMDPIGGNTSVKVDEYPVVAFKIKFNNTGTPEFGGINVGTNKATRPNGNTSGYFSNEQLKNETKTGEWQLFVWDGTGKVYNASDNSTIASFCGTYEGVIWLLTKNGATTTENDISWIQWAGAFKTAADAEAYYNLTTKSDGGGNQEPEDPVTPPVIDEPEDDSSISPFLYNFKEEDKTNELLSSGYVGAGDCKNIVLEYDKTESALKISPKDYTAADAARFELRSSDTSIEVSEYPVIAIKIKTKNTDRNFGGIWPGTLNNGTSSKYKAKDVCQLYNRTGDWELLIYDGTNSTDQYYIGQWYGILVRLMANNVTPTENDVCWIEWAGVFKTAEDAENYYLKSCNSLGYENSLIGDGSGKDAPSGYFYNFTDRATTESLIKGNNGVHLIHNDGSNTVFSYDPTLSALKIQPKNLTTERAGRLILESADPNVSTEDYPIYALKIKVNTVDNGFAGMWAGTKNSGEKTIYSGPELLDQSTHATTGEWQLIILNCEGNKGFAGEWKAMLFRMLNDSVLPQEGEAYWIQWAGAFKTVEDVYAYADMAMPTDEEENTHPFFYDFSNKVNTNIWLGNGKVRVENDSNTALSYDESEQALKLGTVDTVNKKAGRVQILANATVNVADYPVMAVMIKINSNRPIGGLLPGTERNDGDSKFKITNITVNQSKTTDWQLLVFDGTDFENEYYTGQWFGFLLRLMGENAVPTENDYAFIKWAGAFRTVEEAYSLAGMTVPKQVEDDSPSTFFYNFSDEWDTVGYIENNAVSVDESNSKLSYSTQEKALKIEPSNYTDSNANVLVMYNRGDTINVSDYPVVALKVKVKNEKSVLNSIWAGTNSKYKTKFRTQLPIDQYELTDDWQYMVIDATGYEVYNDAYTGTWFGLIFKLMDVNITPTKDDVFYIQWAGVFADADAAYDYAGIENPNKNTPSDPDGKAPTKFFWDLTKSAVITNHVTTVGDTATEYDFAANAMKVTVTDTNYDGAVVTTPGRFILGEKIPVTEEIKATDYPYIAMRVKLPKETTNGGWAYFRTTYSVEKYLSGDMDASDCAVKLLDYDATSEWQTVIIDCTADPTSAFFFDGNWSALIFDTVSSATALEGDSVYVKWAGAFASESDITDYIQTTEGSSVKKTDTVVETPEKSGLSVPAVIGIVVAAVAVIGGVAFGAVFFIRKRRITLG